MTDRAYAVYTPSMVGFPPALTYGESRFFREKPEAGVEDWSMTGCTRGVIPVVGVHFPFASGWSETILEVGPEFSTRRWRAGLEALACSVGIWDRPINVSHTPPDPQALFQTRLYEDHPLMVERVYRALRQCLEESVFRLNPDIMPAALFTVTVQDLLNEIQYHLLCSPDSAAGITWDLWTQAEVLGFLNERLRRIYLEAGPYVSRTTWVPPLDLVTPHAVPVDYLQIRRLSWYSGTALTSKTLQPVDVHTADLLYPDWQTSYGVPQQYVEDPEVAGQFQTVPNMSANERANGYFNLHYIEVPDTLTSTSAVPLSDLFTPYLKYGVMADCLSKQGEANDPQRAAYCEKRFGEGLELIRILLGVSSGDQQR